MQAANQPHFNERGLMEATIPPEADIQQSLMAADGQSLADWMEARVARFSSRKYDWDALKFQADYDPIYRHAQMRCAGTGGTGVATDMNTVPPGVCREETNIGDKDALMCVMLGTPKPITPTYPPDSPSAKIKRDMLAAMAK